MMPVVAAIILNSNRSRWDRDPPTHILTSATYHRYDDYPPDSPPATPTDSARSYRLYCNLFVAFSFVTLTIFLLIVNPRVPEFDLQQVVVKNMTIGPTTPCTTAISLNISMNFSFTNHNKYGIEYEKSTFNVTYRDITLGSGTIETFDQPSHSGKRIETSVDVDRVSLMQPDAAYFVRDASLHDRVEFSVVGYVRKKNPIIRFYALNAQVWVDCTIAISPRRKALISKQCYGHG